MDQPKYRPADAPTVVLDDDPTGVQTLAGVRALLAWDAERVREALDGRPAVHLITNTRALPGHRVQPFVADAARAARSAAPNARIVLRGDSTLRGHLLEEYLGVREVIAPDRWPVLLLVPALPAAGRITVSGLHLFEQDGVRTPLHETEYARDGVFAYTDARVLAWAEERTDGLFRAADGRELHLEELRAGGPAGVASALRELQQAERPAALVPDVEESSDLALIARGFQQAATDGVTALVRCAPAFAGVLSGTTAAAPVPAPRADRVLVVCGSYVPATTAQLEVLQRANPGSLVEVDVEALASGHPEQEIARAAQAASALLRRSSLAVLATPRLRPRGTETLAAGERISAGLARTAGAVDPRPGCVIAKGGITSCVTLRDGFGVAAADVVGPVLPGVSHWRAGGLGYLVVPGNVGDERLLADVVARVLGG